MRRSAAVRQNNAIANVFRPAGAREAVSVYGARLSGS